LPNKLTSGYVFKMVVVVTIVFSIPDFLGSIGYESALGTITNYIPLSDMRMGWIFPALISFVIANSVSSLKPTNKK
jgi:LIVCS family branched-chain amino acid:cation transporter